MNRRGSFMIEMVVYLVVVAGIMVIVGQLVGLMSVSMNDRVKQLWTVCASSAVADCIAKTFEEVQQIVVERDRLQVMVGDEKLVWLIKNNGLWVTRHGQSTLVISGIRSAFFQSCLQKGRLVGVRLTMHTVHDDITRYYALL
jgi:hypothetical protein